MTSQVSYNKKHTFVILVVVLVLLLCVAAGAMVLWSQRATKLRRGAHLPYLALAYTLYADDHEHALPPLAKTPGVLSGNIDALYPQHFSDLVLLFNPTDPQCEKVSKGGMTPEEAAARSSYVYLGTPVTSDEEVAEWAKAYRAAVRSKQPISAVYGPWVLGAEESKDAPLLIELPREYPGDWGLWLGAGGVPLSAPVMGGLVAYADGHVRFIRYPGLWPMTEETVSHLREIRALREGPQVETAAESQPAPGDGASG